MKLATVIAFVILSTVLWWHNDPAWDVVATTPHVASPIGDGLDCSEFVHRNAVKQVICFRSEDRWWGKAVVPAYYTQDGGKPVPLF